MMGAMRSTRHLLTAAATAAVLALAGCGEDEPDVSAVDPTPPASSVTPTETEEPAPTTTEETPAGTVVEATIEGDSALPIAEQVELRTGETLTLVMESDRAGELHVHSTPEQVVEFPAGSNEYELSFDKPGTVDIEEHDTGVLLFRVLVS
jgi:hypothetical protein